MSAIGDRIIIQSINRQTGKLDKAGDFFRIMYMAACGMRHTLFCDTTQELSTAVENIIRERMQCKMSKPTESPTMDTQKIQVTSS